MGDPTIRDGISVNGIPLQITLNLAAALKQFRRAGQDITLWADAISVNQDDLVERGHQVTFMRRVFSQATCTWAWLGEESDESDMAMDLAALLSTVARDCAVRSRELGLQETDYGPWGPVSTWRPEAELSALQHLLGRPWWYRIWVVQEVALSKEVVLHCGPRNLPWDNFEMAVCLMTPLADVCALIGAPDTSTGWIIDGIWQICCFKLTDGRPVTHKVSFSYCLHAKFLRQPIPETKS